MNNALELSDVFVNESQEIQDDRLGVYELCDEDELPPPLEEFAWIVKRFDDQTQAAAEKTEQIDVDTPEDSKILLISTGLEPDIRKALISLLKEYMNAFAWSYEDMPGLDPDLVEHCLVLHPDAKPVK